MGNKYKRILLKLSGEALLGEQGHGIDGEILTRYANEIKTIQREGIEVSIVIGGGNIFRGVKVPPKEWIVCKVIIWECLPP